MTRSTRFLGMAVASALIACAGNPAQAQRLAGAEIISALQDGGYVLVIRQAPASLEAARASGGGGGGGFGGGGGRGGRGGAPAPEPTEEALEQESIELLTGMRHAIWHFQIPIGAIYTSPARAAAQVAEEVPFADITVVDDLDEGNSGSGWLAARLSETPMTGTNSIVVTHASNIEADLDVAAAAGETLVVRPGAEPAIVGRLGLREWSVLAIELD